MSNIKIALVIVLTIIWIACVALAIYGVLKIAEGDFTKESIKNINSKKRKHKRGKRK